MAQNVLTHRGTIVPRRTLRRLTQDELANAVETKKRDDFDKIILNLLGDSLNLPKTDNLPLDLDLQDFSDVPDLDADSFSSPTKWEDDDPLTPDGALIFDTSVTDTLISAEVMLPHDDQLQIGRVVRRNTNHSGSSLGTYDSNPFLNTATYDVIFPDDSVKHFGTNIIAQNLYSQVDTSGHSLRVLDSILDYRKSDNAVSCADMFVFTKSGQRRQRRSTVG